TFWFGDYFEARYDKAGFVPWVSYRPTRGSYDVQFNYYRQLYRKNTGWEKGLRELYAARRSGDVARPPQTLVQQQKVVNHITVNKTTNVTVNKTINITNIQNTTVLAPVTKVNNLAVTNLASLARPHGEVKDIKPTRVVKMETVSKEQKVVDQKVLATQRE